MYLIFKYIFIYTYKCAQPSLSSTNRTSLVGAIGVICPMILLIGSYDEVGNVSQ